MYFVSIFSLKTSCALKRYATCIPSYKGNPDMAERGSADSKTRFYPIYKNEHVVIMGLYTKGTKKEFSIGNLE